MSFLYEVYCMKTDVIKEALENVKKEDPKLYEDVVEYISSNRTQSIWCILAIGRFISAL